MRSEIIAILAAWMLTGAASVSAVEGGKPAPLPASIYSPPPRSASDEVAPFPESETLPIPASPAVTGKEVQPTAFNAPLRVNSEQRKNVLSNAPLAPEKCQENAQENNANLGNADVRTEQTTSSNTGLKAIFLSPHRDVSARRSAGDKEGEQSLSAKTSGPPSMTTLLGSLGVVLGLFLVAAWLLRRRTPQSMTKLPNEVYEVLGRGALAGRQQVHLLRCGSKLVLVSVTPGGAETITEITDPQEVDRVAGICRQTHPHSSSAAFQQVFEQLAPKRPAREAYDRESYGEFNLSNLETVASTKKWGSRHV